MEEGKRSEAACRPCGLWLLGNFRGMRSNQIDYHASLVMLYCCTTDLLLYEYACIVNIPDVNLLYLRPRSFYLKNVIFLDKLKYIIILVFIKLSMLKTFRVNHLNSSSLKN